MHLVLRRADAVSVSAAGGGSGGAAAQRCPLAQHRPLRVARGAGSVHQQTVSVMMANSWGSVVVILGTLYGGRVTAPVNLAAGVLWGGIWGGILATLGSALDAPPRTCAKGIYFSGES